VPDAENSRRKNPCGRTCPRCNRHEAETGLRQHGRDGEHRPEMVANKPKSLARCIIVSRI